MRYLLILIIFITLQLSTYSEESVSFKLQKGIVLNLTSDKFFPEDHKISYCEPVDTDGESKRICLIDGQPVFGSDGDMPETILKSAIVMINGREIRLEVNNMFDPWFEKPEAEFFSVEENDHGIIIRGEFSDDDGAYYAEWLIVEGASVRISIFYKQC